MNTPTMLWQPLDLSAPIREKRSMIVRLAADLFDGTYSFQQIAEFFGVMAACGDRHNFHLHTEYPERADAWDMWIRELECDPWTECHHFALMTEPQSDGVDGPIHALSTETFGRPWPLPTVTLTSPRTKRKNSN